MIGASISMIGTPGRAAFAESGGTPGGAASGWHAGLGRSGTNVLDLAGA